MKNISGAKYGSYSAKGLWYVSYPVINIQVRSFAINATRHYKLSEFLYEAFQFVVLCHVIWNIFVNIVFIIADNVGQIVNNFFIVFSKFADELEEIVLKVLLELFVKILTHLAEAFVKFLC
jgi:hypothetical protein